MRIRFSFALVALALAACGGHGHNQPCMIDQTGVPVCSTQVPTPTSVPPASKPRE